jgi:anti-sigma regulatory factor (Ser/Thr protein kinase)
MGGGVQRLELELPPVPEAARVAREAVDRVAGNLASDVGFRARLAASELVSNSVTHAVEGTATRITVAVDQTATGVRVEVRDGGEPFDPAVREVTDRATSGRGLRLVDALVDRWGVSPSDGNLVWFEIDRPAGGDRPGPRFPRGGGAGVPVARSQEDETVLAAAVLAHAALRVREGWCQGVEAIDRRRAAVAPLAPEAVAWSLLGALVSAEGLEPSAGRLQAVATAMTAIAAVVGGRSLTTWNDAPGRTQREVIAVLERARMRTRACVVG